MYPPEQLTPPVRDEQLEFLIMKILQLEKDMSDLKEVIAELSEPKPKRVYKSRAKVEEPERENG